MDRGTGKPEVAESLMTDGIIHDLASTDWTASLQNELFSNVRSDLGVTGHQVNNVCECDPFPGNIVPNSSDHQEDVHQNTSIPAVKQEFIDISPKKEITEDVFKEEINVKPINGEIPEYIKLADDVNCPQLGTVRTNTQPVVIKNEMAEDGAQEDYEGPMNSGNLGINEMICKVKIENGLIEPTVRDESDLVVTCSHKENVYKCEHQEDIKQDTSIPAVKQEMMDIVIKEEIYESQIIEEEIQDCKESIELEDDINSPLLDSLKETVKTESQPVVTRNELFKEDGLQEERNNRDSDDEVPRLRFSKRLRKTRILPGAVTITSFNEGSDFAESHFLSSGEDSDLTEDENQDLKSNLQSHKNKRQKKIRSMDDEEYVPRNGDNRHGSKKKSGPKLSNDTHRRSRSADRHHQCEVCAKFFKTSITLRNHLCLESDQLKYSHQEVKLFACTDCGKLFSWLRNLKKHQLNHTGKKLFACEICDKSYAETTGLRRHMATHQEVKPFLCADCGKSFSQLCHLKRHQLLHTDKKLYACEICDKSYAQPAGLRYHMITHQEVKPFTCTDCGKSFARPTGLHRHMVTHQEVKLFLCADCGKSFSQLCHLKRHQLLHTGKNLYACEICDKTFVQPTGLHRHMVTHQEVKPFLCADCGKSFSQLCHLKRHQLLHTGKELFACETSPSLNLMGFVTT